MAIHSGDKWQSKSLFLTIFDLRLSIVLMFPIATYPVVFNPTTAEPRFFLENTVDPNQLSSLEAS